MVRFIEMLALICVDIFVTSDVGCTASQFTSTAFDFTVYGVVPEIGNSSALLICSCKLPGAAAQDTDESKVRD